LRPKLSLWVADQKPTNLDRLFARVIPNGSLATNFDLALARAIPALDLQFPPDILRVTENLGQRWLLRRGRLADAADAVAPDHKVHKVQRPSAGA
jgi:hypothetical protein